MPQISHSSSLTTNVTNGRKHAVSRFYNARYHLLSRVILCSLVTRLVTNHILFRASRITSILM